MAEFVSVDKLIRRLERFRDSLPEGANMTVKGLVSVVTDIIRAEAKANDNK